MTRSGNLAYDVLVNEDAVLTDPGLTAEQARAVGDWVGDRPGNRFTLEGRDLVIVKTDSADSTVLHVPDLGLVVAGDVIYNGVHMYLAQRAIVGGLGPGGPRSTRSRPCGRGTSSAAIRTRSSTTTPVGRSRRPGST